MARRDRADEVRQKRGARRKTVKPGRGRESNSLSGRSLPPMVSRRGVFTTPPQSQTRKEARRRFNVALPALGAELALPAIPRVQVGMRVVSFLLVCALAFAMYSVWTAPQFHVQAVEVEGLARIPAYEIEAVLKLTGASIFTIDPADALQRLQAAFPDLSDVQVRVGFPAQVRVIGAERQPVLAWEQEGVTFWLDAAGYRFVPRGEVALPRVVASKAPPAPGLPGEEISEYWFTSPAMIDSVLALTGQAPEGAAIIYDPQHGLGWIDPNRGWKVYFGQAPDQMELRLAIYEAIKKEVKGRGLNPAFISVETLHAPYFRISEP